MFSRSASAIEDFNLRLGELPHRHKIVVPGNHEFFLEAEPRRRSLISQATVLIDQGCEIDGLRIWGSPITPLSGAAFGQSSPEARTRHWSKLPSMDVLVTHGPPFGILDCSPDQPEHMGDPELLEAVERIKPVLHVYGHVHGAFGRTSRGDTNFVNCALLGLDGALRNRPVSLRLPRVSSDDKRSSKRSQL